MTSDLKSTRVVFILTLVGLLLLGAGVATLMIKDAAAHGEVNPVRGGQLYDKWWVVVASEDGEADHDHSDHAHEAEAPQTDHPLWATQGTNTRSGAETWRCKECHGWDYRGAEGAYGSGSHFTGFAGVLGAASLSPDEIRAALNGTTNADHNFVAAMDEVALNALVTFLQAEMTDITEFVSGDGSVTGDPRLGRDLFQGTCAACHGVDGQRINFGSQEAPEFIGTVAVENPWEFFHKASFGQPGEPMPSGRALGWTLQDIADVLAFAQTLPTE